ncbi:MAG: hypothetical protein HYZ50_13330 [Deltaproteobacteria bacterium]|nr:hypothetical protein [Deltaproteobacteria bacterium]
MGTRPELLALIDIGSNAVRCLVAECSPGNGFKIAREERGQTRLGGGTPGELPASAVEETVATIRRFLAGVRQEIAQGRQFCVLAIATAAVRDATNRNALLGALKQETGVTVRILSGEEEARFGALAAMERLAFRDGVVMDLGGGSLQISRVRSGEVQHTSSLPLGALRTTRQFFRNDPPIEPEVLVLRKEVRRLLIPLLSPADEAGALIGTGGAVRALASMHLATLPGPAPSRHGYRLERSAVARLRERLAACSAWERRGIPGLKAERADIILAGAIVIEEVMTLGGYEALTVCKDGVRHGVLLHKIFHQGA